MNLTVTEITNVCSRLQFLISPTLLSGMLTDYESFYLSLNGMLIHCIVPGGPPPSVKLSNTNSWLALSRKKIAKIIQWIKLRNCGVIGD